MEILYAVCGIGALALLLSGAANNYTYVHIDEES